MDHHSRQSLFHSQCVRYVDASIAQTDSLLNLLIKSNSRSSLNNSFHHFNTLRIRVALLSSGYINAALVSSIDTLCEQMSF